MITTNNCGLIIIDVQECLFPKIHDHKTLLKEILLLYKGLEIFNIPLLITEQYPQGLGKTVPEIHAATAAKTAYAKTSFSCFGDPHIRKKILSMKKTHWILAGIEAHICVLQTAQGLLAHNMKVIVPQEATSSRHKTHYERALIELVEIGARVTSVESLLFELAHDAKTKEFQKLKTLFRTP